MPSEYSITDSDLMGLVEQRKLLLRRQWWRKSETIAVLVVLFGCGYGAGYIHASAVAERNYAAMRLDHVNEIERLQASQTVNITTASETAKDAANTAAGAAAKVDAAADKVERAAAPKGNGK